MSYRDQICESSDLFLEPSSRHWWKQTRAWTKSVSTAFWAISFFSLAIYQSNPTEHFDNSFSFLFCRRSCILSSSSFRRPPHEFKRKKGHRCRQFFISSNKGFFCTAWDNIYSSRVTKNSCNSESATQNNTGIFIEPFLSDPFYVRLFFRFLTNKGSYEKILACFLYISTEEGTE